MKKHVRVALTAIALVAALAATTIVSPGSVSAAHEPTCFAAYQTGNYNLVVGSGSIKGTNGNDLIIGSTGDDVIKAGNGNDIVCGRGGNDTISGGNGADSLLGDVCDSCDLIPGAEASNGAPGNDTIYGGNGDELRIWGDEGDDRLYGQNGNDALVGGNPGGDGDETDLCDGANGTDTATRCDTLKRVP